MAENRKLDNLNIDERKEEERRRNKTEESSHGTVNPETSVEVKPADDPHAGEDSALPGTGNDENIGNAQSGAGVGGNKGRGTANFPNKE